MFSFFSSTSAYTEEDAFWYLSPSADEKAVLGGFRAALEQQGALVAGFDDEYTLLRFLKAREFNLGKALAMYTDMRQWRIDNAVEMLYDDDPHGKQFTVSELLQVYPHFYVNTDRFGRPVYYELLGKTDATRLFEVISIERLIRYHIWTWERYLKRYLPPCSTAAGRHICTTTVVIDLEGFGLSHFNTNTRKLLESFSKIDQDHYPEHLGTMLVINTPLVFRGIWAAVQPLLQERTRKKIILLGSDYQAELLRFIPPENLPAIYGGKVQLDERYGSVGPWQQHQQHQQSQQAERPEQRPEHVADGGAAAAARELANADAHVEADDAGSSGRGEAPSAAAPASAVVEASAAAAAAEGSGLVGLGASGGGGGGHARGEEGAGLKAEEEEAGARPGVEGLSSPGHQRKGTADAACGAAGVGAS